MDLQSCQVIASDKSNSLRKGDFVLKSGFQVNIFSSFEGRIPCYNGRTLCLQMSATIIFGTS